MSRLIKKEKYGYISKKRDRFSKLSKSKRIIYWWIKGYSDCYYYKCDTYTPNGYYVEGISDTSKEAINNCISWFKILK